MSSASCLQKLWKCPSCKAGREPSAQEGSVQRQYLLGGQKISVAKIVAFRQENNQVQYSCQWYEPRRAVEKKKSVSVSPSDQVYCATC